MSGIFKSQVSTAMCRDRRAGADLPARPIEGDWPYLWINATYLKVRQAGRGIVSVAAIIAIGANSDGRREVLGMQVGASEAEPFWGQTSCGQPDPPGLARGEAGDLRCP